MNRALLVGINNYPSSLLSGCINDIQDMADFLVKHCNFEMSDIRLLADERATKKGIIDRLGWLLNGLHKGDRVLFHYSGHGVQLPTRNPQGEVDGLDEAICPVDFDWTDKHTVRDKDFNKLFSNIPVGVEFIWISDSCHSGDLSRDMESYSKSIKTMIPPVDINWRLQTAKKANITATGMNRTAAGLNLALISGCKSHQSSADAVFDNRPNGALTYFLLQELHKENGLSLPLSKVVKKVNSMLQNEGFEQAPQLEGNSEIKARPFLFAG